MSLFSTVRYEHEGRNVYFLPEALWGRLHARTSHFLIGSRGTGKTTLLKSLDWRERMDNPNLQSQLDDDPFSDRTIGLYMKAPAVQVVGIGLWTEQLDEYRAGLLTAHYLDLLLIEQAAKSVAKLSQVGVLPISPATEQRRARSILDDFKKHAWLRDALDNQRPDPTFLGIHGTVVRARTTFESHALGGGDPQETLGGLPTGSFGELGRNTARGMLLGNADDRHSEDADDGLTSWSFRFCIDESEVLTSTQIRALNTLVRLAEWPVTYLISFVRRPDELDGTLLPRLSLQRADRELIQLDRHTDAEFRELVEGITRLRAELAGYQGEFSLTRLLGSMDLNGTLREQLENSQRQDAQRLMEAGVAKGSAPRSGSPLILEAYLDEVEDRRQAGSRGSDRDAAQESSKNYRKRMVAAYLSICHKFGLKVRYSGDRILLQMCDSCIRDYLWNMHEIVSADDPSGSRQQSEDAWNRIASDVQQRGLDAAGEHKLEKMPNYVVYDAARSEQLVRALAMITARLQRTSPGYEHLRSHERGWFYLDGVGHPDATLEILKDAVEAGYLRTRDVRIADDSRFRVHTSMAAHFGFSYRGAYYDVGLVAEELSSMLDLEHEVEDLTAAVVGRIDGTGAPQTEKLFEP